MSDQNQPNDPNQNPVQGDNINDQGNPRPVLTTEEIPAKTPPVGTATDLPFPSIPEASDIPPPPGPERTDAVVAPDAKTQTTTPSFDLPPIVGAPPKKKFGGKKIISTILGILLLVGGVGVGVNLVQKNQNLQEEAFNDGACGSIETKGECGGCHNGFNCVWRNDSCKKGSACTKATTPPSDACKGDCITGLNKDCTEIGRQNLTGNCNKGACCSKGPGDDNKNGLGENCLRGGSGPETRDAKFEGKCKVAKCPNGDTNNNDACDLGDNGFSYGGSVDCTQGVGALGGGCGQVDPIGNDGTYCKTATNKGHYGKVLTGNCSASVATEKPKASEPPTTTGGSAQCQAVKAYDTNFNQLTTDQLKALKPGDKVRFAVSGTTTAGGSFDKARFKINSTDSGEVTTKKPSSSEFYYEFTVPTTGTAFTVTAQIHHTTLGWSN